MLLRRGLDALPPFDLVEADPKLEKTEHRTLRRALERYRAVFELVSVS